MVKRILHILEYEFKETISVSIIETVAQDHKDYKLSEIRQSVLAGQGVPINLCHRLFSKSNITINAVKTFSGGERIISSSNPPFLPVHFGFISDFGNILYPLCIHTYKRTVEKQNFL